MTENNELEYYDIDVINTIKLQVKRAQGYDVIIKELIQNADDAPHTDSMSFTVFSDKLVVTNNGLFTEMDWKSIKKYASGGKSGDENTTGFFGIGFAATYAITNTPTIYSGSKGLQFYPNSETGRIPLKTLPAKPDAESSTVFEFPWAFATAESQPIRDKFGIEPLPTDIEPQFFTQLHTVVPESMLFLRKLRTITIQCGKEIIRYTRNCDEAARIIEITTIGSESGTMTCKQWLTFTHDFTTEFAKETHRYKPERAKAVVTIAVPIASQLPASVADWYGIVYATLPTKQSTHVPFHINADFIPEDNRNQLNQYSPWNQRLLCEAMNCFSEHLDNLVTCESLEYVWQLLKLCFDKRDVAGNENWTQIAKNMKSQPPRALFRTMKKDDYRVPSELKYFDTIEHYNCLEHLPMKWLPSYVPARIIFEIAGKELIKEFIDNHVTLEGFLYSFNEIKDICVSDKKLYENLIREISLLFKKEHSTEALENFAGSYLSEAIALNCHNEYRSVNDVWYVPSKLAQIFKKLCWGQHILKYHGDEAITKLIPKKRRVIKKTGTEHIEIEGLIEFLTAHHSHIAIAYAQDPLQIFPVIIELLKVIESSVGQLTRGSVEPLKTLQIWPTCDGKISFAGEQLCTTIFTENPLQDDKQVRDDALQAAPKLCGELGIKERSFADVLQQFQKKCEREEPEWKQENIVKMIGFLNSNIASIKETQTCIGILKKTKCILCIDGKYHSGNEGIYFSSKVEHELLPQQFFCTCDVQLEQVYTIAGVRSAPTFDHIVSEIKRIMVQPVNNNREHMQNLVKSIFSDKIEVSPVQMYSLRNSKWLPAKGSDTWHNAADLYKPKYFDLVDGTDIKVLDLRPDLSEKLFKSLSVTPKEPTRQIIWKYLLYCNSQHISVQKQVYGWFFQQIKKEKHEDIEKIKAEIVEKCWLLQSDGRYIATRFAYLDQSLLHQPGSDTLINQMEVLNKEICTDNAKEILIALGVKERPDAADYIAMLRKLTNGKGSVDDEVAKDIRLCWKYLAKDVSVEQQKELGTFCNIIDDSGKLQKPHEIYVYPEEYSTIFDQKSPRLIKPFIDIDFLEKIGCHNIISDIKPELDFINIQEDEGLTERLKARMLKFIGIIEYYTKNKLSHIYENLYNTDTIQVKSVRGGSIIYHFPQESGIEHITLSLADYNGYFDWSNMTAYYDDASQSQKVQQKVQQVVHSIFILSGIAESTLFPTLGILLTMETEVESENHCRSYGIPYCDSTPPDNRQKVPVMKVDIEIEYLDITSDKDDGVVIPKPSVIGDVDNRLTPTNEKGSRLSIPPHPHIHPYNDHPTDELHNNVSVGYGKTTNEHNIDVDRRGMDRIKRYLEEEGYNISDVSQDSSKGYDIEATNTLSTTIYIELKSCNGKWDASGVALTKHEYDVARSLKSSYYIYIIEYIGDDSQTQLYIIENVADAITAIFLGDEWKKKSEQISLSKVHDISRM